MIDVVEINADNRIAAVVSFDPDDIDAAFKELDTRYLAGEAAAHSHTWTLMAEAFAALNRHELPETTPDFVIVDHQLRHTTEASGLTEYLRAQWDLTPDLRMYIEAVHRLSDLGAVVTLAVRGTSTEGFDADWRFVELLTREGDVGKRCEIFNEADIDAALARFDELSRPVPQLQNTASRVDDRFKTYFAARDLDAMVELLADDTATDDRRPLVGVGVRRGRDAVIADWRATAEIGVKNIISTVIATRGERLVLSRYLFSGRDRRPEAFRTDVLGIVEIDADNRISACVMFDLDDIDAAFAELDARYIAGEAATHARTWSVVAQTYAAFNRHELPPTTPDWVNIDHRRGACFRARRHDRIHPSGWDLTPDSKNVHRGRASAERLRRGRHPYGTWDLTRGL